MPAPGLVDLRSDTLTVPDDGMRAAMARAEVGDDVWGEDPTVRRLEEEMARRLGKAAAVYVPSGTMGNLACVAAQTRPGDEVIADAQAHVVSTKSAAPRSSRASSSEFSTVLTASLTRSRSPQPSGRRHPSAGLHAFSASRTRTTGEVGPQSIADTGARRHARGTWARAAGALRWCAVLQRRRRARCRTRGAGGRVRHGDRLREQGARCSGRVCGRR